MALREAEFQENKEDLGLSGAGFFTAPRDPNNQSGREQENTILMGQLGGSVESQQARGQEAAKGTEELRRREKEKAKARLQDQLLRDLLKDIEDMERAIADKYGDNFAMDLIAHLHEKGKISKEDYDYIASMQDLSQQRHAAALIVQRGRENGTLTQEDYKDFEWATDKWLDNHTRASQLRDTQAEQLLRQRLSLDEASASAKTEADEKSQNIQAFQEAVENERATNELVQGGETLVADLNLDDLGF